MSSVISDVLVVGLGAVGSAAIYQSARQGAQVIGIDRFHPPHEFGSSHGDTRITREAIGEGREYVPLVQRSHQIWAELEMTTGRSLLTRNGGLILASPHVPGSHHGRASFVQDTIKAAEEFGIPHEVLSTEEVQRRYPQFRLRGDEIGYFEPGAGFLRPEACIEAQLSEARRLGAVVHTSEIVLAIRPDASGSVAVTTDKAQYSAAEVIISAGPWIDQLLPDVHRLFFRVYRQVMNWFAIASDPDLHSPERMPIFIWLTGSRPRDMLYGFPAIAGAEAGLKVASEQYDEPINPDEVNRNVTAAEIQATYAEYVKPHLPHISGQCLRSKTCLYTVTPDAKFIIDSVPGCEHVVFASACSGHGFKHSAAIGEALAKIALRQPVSVDLTPFRLDRFGTNVG